MTRARAAAAWRIEELVLDRASSKAQSEAELTTDGTSMSNSSSTMRQEYAQIHVSFAPTDALTRRSAEQGRRTLPSVQRCRPHCLPAVRRQHPTAPISS